MIKRSRLERLKRKCKLKWSSWVVIFSIKERNDIFGDIKKKHPSEITGVTTYHELRDSGLPIPDMFYFTLDSKRMLRVDVDYEIPF